MKDKIVYGILFLLQIILGSCSQQASEDFFNEKNAMKGVNKYTPEDLIMKSIKNHYVHFFDDTRSDVDLRVKSVEIFDGKSNKGTRSINPNYLILNFEDGRGFSIITRSGKILALSDEGEIHLSDTITNKGLSWYLNEYLEAGMEPFNPPFPPDSTLLVDPEIFYGVKYKPLITGFKSEFGQGKPYNTYCFTSNGEQAVVGCVPLAVGTIMGYFKWPLSYGDYKFDWSAMRKSNLDDGWARLFEIVGRPENTNVFYGVTSSAASPSNIVRTLENMGYTGAKRDRFDKDLVLAEIANNTPVMVNGYVIGNITGHRWVIDGAYRVDVDLRGPTELSSYYYHCIWGEYGSGNAYYYLDDHLLGGTSNDQDETLMDLQFSLVDVVYGYKPDK